MSLDMTSTTAAKPQQIHAVSDSLADQPEFFHVYRGEAEGSMPYHKAFSWSLNINTAFFFACRHGDRNHCRIIRAKVRKKDVMASKLDSKEMEVIILPGKVFDVSKEKLLGLDSPAVMPPKYLDEYANGRDRIKALYKEFLRLPISHKLVPLAVSAVNGIEI